MKFMPKVASKMYWKEVRATARANANANDRDRSFD
jgi:hypothetical protein|tara:strand:+ start:3602 stop:3706 length:105 start_codon:yes stop_codon:yes gene_type:complete